jgi:hypothetical protein
MDIPYGHRVKIMKRISGKNKKDKESGIDEIQIKNNIREISKNNYEELPSPVHDINNFDNNNDEGYDEELQRKLFQEAVNEFRHGKKNFKTEDVIDIKENSNKV